MKQLFRVAEVPVQIDFREQEGQVLEILGIEGVPEMVAFFRDSLPMADDVVVIAQEQVTGEFLPVKKPGDQDLMKAAYVVFRKAFQFRDGDPVGKLFQAVDLEQGKHPLVEDQLLVEFQGRGLVPGPAALCSGGHGRFLKSHHGCRTSGGKTPAR
ncbi:MAG: hypothetical protein ABIM40_07405 [Pseudomonadota bacterium]